MVGPSLSESDQKIANARLQAGFVLLVGVSMALVSLQTDPSYLQIAGSFLVGLLVGLALLLFLRRSIGSIQPPSRR